MSVAEAEALRREQEATLEAMCATMGLPGSTAGLDSELLRRVNLISGVVAGDE